MSKTKVAKRSQISIEIGLNAEQMPIEMHWGASDKPGGRETCKGMLLSLFDEQSKDTMKIDLWTRDLQVVEMDRFMYQTLRGLVDTYHKATGNTELANEMQKFVFYFGQKTGAIPQDK